MTRTKGATNITPFDARRKIPVSGAQAIQFRSASLGPLEQFKAGVVLQRNYLDWLQSRHDRIIDLNDQLVRAQTGQPPKRKAAKDATHRKYLWFAESMALLDVINSFEFFYKASCIGLATALADLIPAGQITGNVEARFIWQAKDYSPQDLVFEHRLFHDLQKVNGITKMLIGKAYYNDQPSNTTYRCIRAIFQIRHTLSHNCGQMTQSDATKLEVLGFAVSRDGALDPGDDNFWETVVRFLVDQAKAFTSWLETETVTYIERNSGDGSVVPVCKSHLLKLFDGSTAFDALNLKAEPANAPN